jgi:hypothetical protein
MIQPFILRRYGAEAHLSILRGLFRLGSACDGSGL